MDSFGGGRAVGKAMMMEAASAPMVASAPSEMVLDRAQFGDRKIAETHNVSIETEADALKGRYDRDFKKCIAVGCEIVNSQVTSREYASLHARIAPEQLGAYLDFLAEGEGELKSHQVSADDQTMAYIDTEARIKNLEVLRQRLFELLDSEKAKSVEGILRVEQES